MGRDDANLEAAVENAAFDGRHRCHAQAQRDRRGRLRDAFWLGVLRGVGSLLGFAVAGTALVYILQYLAERNLPVISDFLARVVTMVQMRLQ